jgi:Ser/Thr protein kinase RdoA (MazF antagonist)
VSSHTATDFASLTRAGKVRRGGQLAADALREYDIGVRSLQKHCFATNLLYRVQSDAGERFVLRMAYPGWRTLENLRAEAAWLAALHEETDIGAPLVIRSSRGEPVVAMHGNGVPGTWYATLMTWVDGRLLAHYLSGANLERMGALFARLHRHGKSWKPPDDFCPSRFEAFLSRGEPDALFGEGGIQAFRDEDRRAFLLAREWVEREYEGLDRGDVRVIHCDLWHENIKLDRGRLRPFDFEDTIWGYRLHDLAMGLLDLLETVGAARYEGLLASFRAGYERLLDWPEGNLGVLQIGRLLWNANWTARFAPESLSSLGEQYGPVFRDFERSGVLRMNRATGL